MSVKLYVEGGGNSKLLRTQCRRGFRTFIEKAGLARRMPRIVACGGRNDAFESFQTAQGEGDEHPMLLVDTEGPVMGSGPWDHLQSRDNWVRPAGATDDQCHLMVQVMESWFLADRTALSSFYGPDFQESAVPANPQVEQIPKADVLAGLEHATRYTQKGRYDKGSHSFEILATLDPNLVQAKSPYARRFLDSLRTAADP